MFDSEKTSTELEQKAQEIKAEEVVEEAAEEAEPAEAKAEGVLNRDKESVPLSAHIRVKDEAKELRKRLIAAEKQLADSATEREKADEVKELLDLGYTEAAAKREADTRIQVKRRLDNMDKRLALTDIHDLSKQGSLYAGADKYTDEIYDAMKQYGVDARKAYLMVCDTDAITAAFKEEQTQQEQRNLLKRGESDDKRVEHAAPTPVKGAPKLNNSDRAALRGLQENQPDAGWTAEKYWKMQYGDTVPKE